MPHGIISVSNLANPPILLSQIGIKSPILALPLIPHSLIWFAALFKQRLSEITRSGVCSLLIGFILSVLPNSSRKKGSLFLSNYFCLKACLCGLMSVFPYFHLIPFLYMLFSFGPFPFRFLSKQGSYSRTFAFLRQNDANSASEPESSGASLPLQKSWIARGRRPLGQSPWYVYLFYSWGGQGSLPVRREIQDIHPISTSTCVISEKSFSFHIYILS